MIESPHAVDGRLGIPVFSLYSETRSPTPEMLGKIDTLVVDLQDVGTRVYTFVWTMALALEACARTGVSVVVLDRPNPIGGLLVEGNGIRPGYESFVGLHSVPMRHGLTVGELAALVNARLAARPGGLRCDLSVVPMQGWRRRMRFAEIAALTHALPGGEGFDLHVFRSYAPYALQYLEAAARPGGALRLFQPKPQSA
jgi:uncharacterized protein YbbC (DUF1343 family)